MKNTLNALLLALLTISTAFSQTGILENFNDNSLDPNWKSVPTGKFSFTESGGQLLVTPSAVGPGYENFELSFGAIDVTGNPTVSVKIKNSSALTLRVDLVDNTGKSTNASPVSKAVAINSTLTLVTFDFTNKFTSSGGGAVDKTKISKVVFFINAGGSAYSNAITLDDVTVGDPIPVVPATPGNIVLNQVGYELTGAKKAIYTHSANSLAATTFDILSSSNTVVYTGNVISKGAVSGWTNRYFWELNFNDFQTPGIYKIRVGTKVSYAFEIGQNILFNKTAYSVVDFFKGMRSTNNADKTLSFNGPRNDQVNVYGGWIDATGDPGKHMSHLSYANYFNPQQIPFVVWSLLKSYEISQTSFTAKSTDLFNESKWGADYLLRNIDKQQNYLYLAIFDNWGNSPSSREICEWGQPGTGNDGARTPNFQAAMREGAGMAIAALARAYRMNVNGDSTKTQYLNGAIRLYNNLKAPGTGYATKNLEYCNDHTENIIDFYCGLLATIELYKATNNAAYLTDASVYADKLIAMLDPQGWFRSDVAGTRPFYHAADEGLPLVSLMEYMDVDASKNTAITQVLNKNISWYMGISKEVNNPFNYMREYYKPYTNGALGVAKKGFFVPHDNETGYWWQGENARLASMSTALLLAARKLNTQFTLGTDSISTYGIAQLDWILGKNPFDVCMMTGAGTTTYQDYPVASAIQNVKGGICNGITGKDTEETNIDWKPYASNDWQNWRWIEQWLPHDAWFLLAVSSLDVANTPPPGPPVASFTVSKQAVCTNAATILTNTSTGSITSYAWNFGTDASISGSTAAGPHTISWTTSGTKTISLTVTGPNGTSTSTSTVTVTAAPAAAGSMTGLAATCANTADLTYSIPAIASATSYVWTLPSGASIMSGENTNSIVVSFAATGGTIEVTPGNTCGTSAPASKVITLTTKPAAAGTITGLTSTCASSTDITYSIPALATATSYTWTVPSGATITSGDNTNAIVVSFGTTAGTIQVTPGNTCGTSAPASKTITLTTKPAAAGTITGLTSTCASSTDITYSIPALATATSYTWTLPSGATITSGDNTNAIVVSFGTTSGTIQVTPGNTCGTSAPASRTVTLTTKPAAAGTMTGLAGTCQNSTGVVYSIPALATATSYAWTLPSGAVITSGDNTNSITVSFATTSGTIQVTPGNACGTSAPKSKTVALTTKPAPAGTITGLANTCQNSTGITYSIPSLATATSYEWTLPSGAIITSGDNTNAITVSFATTGGTIQVTPGNTCGSSAAASKTITLNPLPDAAGAITGLTATCASAAGITYSVPASTNATGYTWSLPSGAAIASGNNTNAVTVSFATAGGTIQVTPTNTCGNGASSSTVITLLTKPAAAGTIDGPINICASATGVSYTITEAAAADSYTWNLPSGAAITAGNNTNSITVSFGTTGGTIEVTPVNGCGNAASAVKTIQVIPVGTAPCTAPVTSGIDGPSSIVPNASNVVFSVTQNSGSTYTWTVPDGAVIVSGQGTNSIVVNFGSTGGNVTVQESNTFGNGTTVSKNVTAVATDITTAADVTISIHPNPTEHYSTLTVSSPAAESVEVTIIDVKGTIIHSEQWNTSEDFLIGTELHAGVYIVQLKINDRLVTKRLVKL